MTLTTAIWISLVAAAVTTAVRAVRTRPVPAPARRTRTDQDDETWRPHVTSGCGR
jgi:hypothetical protein